MNAPADIQLLLIGPTGHGRSATGNSILGRHYFNSSSSPTSLTSEIECGLSEFNSRRVKVVDGPGVGLTHTNEQKAVNLHKASMEYAIAANPQGYDAFLLVVRFGERFTTEVDENFDCLKKIFGQDFVRNYCILVVTCGDLFKQEKGNVRKSIEEWIDENPGVLRDLANECERRVVLFDNVTTDGTRHEQVQKLHNMLDNLKSKGNRYTDEDFAQAREGRQRYIAETQKVLIQEEAMLEVNLILKATEDIQLLEDLETKMAQLQAVQMRAHNLSKKIAALDNGTGVFKEMVVYLTWVKRYVDDQVKAHVEILNENNVTNPHQNTALIMDVDGINQQREQKNITTGKSSMSLDEPEARKKRSEPQHILLGERSREDIKEKDSDNEKQPKEETKQKCKNDQAQGNVKNMNEKEIILQTEQNQLTDVDGIKQATDDDATISKELSPNKLQATKNQQTQTIQPGKDSNAKTDQGEIVTQMQAQEEHCKEQMICQNTRNTDDEKTSACGMPDNTLGAASNTIKLKDAIQVDLLLIGRTREGKSATGNSILRRRAFRSKASTASVTSKVDYEVSEFNGRIIKVVDCPGVGKTEINNEAAVRLVMTCIEQAISANPRGYHAFLLVVRFGSRFSDEDQDPIDFLKKILGQDFVKDFCILVLTCGDNFENDSVETGKSFEDWCNEEQGKFKDLLTECDNRVVLFDNATKDPEKKSKQIENLLKVVDSLSFNGKRYTDENFERAREQRDTIMVELKKSAITEETMTETSLILMKLQQLQAEEDLGSKIDPLEKLKSRVKCLLESLSSKDQATGALQELISSVKSIKSNINNEIKFCYRMMDEREKTRLRKEENRRKYEEQIQILKEQQDMKAREEVARLKKQMEEKNKQENEAMEKTMKEELAKLKKQNEDTEAKYRKAKEENDTGIISRVYDTVTWPVRKVWGWW